MISLLMEAHQQKDTSGTAATVIPMSDKDNRVYDTAYGLDDDKTVIAVQRLTKKKK